MKLQLVSKEQAIRLRDVGFPQDKHDLGYTICKCSDRFNVYEEGTLTENASSMIKKVSAPSLELAAKWLRKEKKIYIDVTWGNVQGNIVWCASLNNLGKGNSMLGDIKYVDSYDEALSKGIDKAIEILKKNGR